MIAQLFCSVMPHKQMVCNIACRALPSSLLLLSRAFTMTQPLAAPKKAGAEYEQLKDTISSLPSKVITEASMEAGHNE